MITCHSYLLQEYGSPLLVYDEEAIIRYCNHMNEFSRILNARLKKDSIVDVNFLAKTCKDPAILSIAKSCNLNVSCSSSLELSSSEKCGFEPKDIFYMAHDITDYGMKCIHEKGLLVCLDSISQVDLWGSIFPNTDIMIKLKTHKNSRGGFDESDFLHLMETVKKHNLNIIGVHQSLPPSSLNNNVSEYVAEIENNLKLIVKHFRSVQIVNLGDVFSIDNSISGTSSKSIHIISSYLFPILKRFLSYCNSVRKLKFESGRYIVCQAGELMSNVTRVDKRFNTWWIGTEINEILISTSSIYNHPVSIIPNSDNSSNSNDEDKMVTSTLCGTMLTAGNAISWNQLTRIPHVGDTAVIYNAGASVGREIPDCNRPNEILVTLGNKVIPINQKPNRK